MQSRKRALAGGGGGGGGATLYSNINGMLDWSTSDVRS